MSVWRSRERGRKPSSYFPRSFTMSKKYPGLGENISRVQGGGERGFDGGAEDQNKFPTAAKGEAGRAAAAPGRTSRIARGSGRRGFLFKFRFGASFTRISRTTNPVPRLNRKRCLPPWTNPHSLQAFAEQSCEVLAGPGRRAEGQ